MVELVEAIAKSLVDHPENVRIKTTEDASGLTIELTVDPDDMGKVIGKQGRIAKAIRTVLKAQAVREDKRVSLDIG